LQLNRLHGVIFQKMILFNRIIVGRVVFYVVRVVPRNFFIFLFFVHFFTLAHTMFLPYPFPSGVKTSFFVTCLYHQAHFWNISTLKMEAACFSGKSISTHNTTKCQNPRRSQPSNKLTNRTNLTILLQTGTYRRTYTIHCTDRNVKSGPGSRNPHSHSCKDNRTHTLTSLHVDTAREV
jgi:hypothetical protein